MIVRRSINKDELKELPKTVFPGRIHVIQSEAETEKAVAYLQSQPILGIDSETRPSFTKGQSHKVALLQISSDECCFLFRLNMTGLTQPLVDLLENPAVIKVGLSLKDDFMMLHKRAPFTQQSCIELQDYVRQFGIQDKSLQKIYAILFKEKISKSQRLSNWEADVLSDGQKQYAATDAWACLNIYNLLQELKEKGALQTRLTIEDFIASFTAEYYNFVQQTLRLENFRYAMALSRERLRIAEAWYHVGSSAQLDVLQARVDFNADSSQYMSQQEAVVASRIRINELLANEELDRRFLVRDTVIAIDDALQWDVLVAETRTANAELLMADRDNAISELELQSIRSRNYPYLNLTAGYGYTHNRYGSGTTRMRGQLGLNAGLQVGFTIFDGNRRREQRNARIGVENAQLTQQRLEQSLRADLSNFWQAYRNNLEVILLEEENLIAAKENYEIAMERYLLGDLPGIEMREAQKSLLDAEERILTAQYNTKLCEISLQQISGNVMVYLE